MRCRFGVCSRSRPVDGSPRPRRIELCAGRGRKENAAATQDGTCLPNGGPSGKHIPESVLRLGCSFRMTPQAESSSRNRRSERDVLSGWRLKRKLRPGICFENETRFPNDRPSGNYVPESTLRTGRTFHPIPQLQKLVRPPSQNWVEESQNAIAGGRHDCRR